MTSPVSMVSSSFGVLPAQSGLGLKPRHYREILETLPPVGFFEVHAENYMGDGGPPHRYLEQIRTHYPLSVHGVGLSIGGDQDRKSGVWGKRVDLGGRRII